MKYIDYVLNKINEMKPNNVYKFESYKKSKKSSKPVKKTKIESPVSSMWEHYCVIEGAYVFVGLDEPCNWCGNYEYDYLMSDPDEDD